MTVRPLNPDDAPLFAAMYERLGPESRRHRFVVAPPELSDEDLRYLTDLDHRRHDALIALDPETGQMVGDARYVALRDQPGAAEVAALVVEDWRGRGLATALLTELSKRARENGFDRYVALVSPDNEVVLDALERLGARHTGTDADQFELEIEIPAEGMPAGMRGALKPAIAAGERALVVEDVVTSGGSLITAIERLREEGVELAGALAVLDRLAGGREAIEQALGDGLPYVSLFTIDDVYPDRPDR